MIQPGNKTLLATGVPIDTNSVADIVRVNNTAPSDGIYFLTFLSPTTVTIRNPSGVSTTATVTVDGSTYNNDVGGSGIDMVFKSNRKRGDELNVEVIAAADGKDTYLRRLSEQRNFGSCTHIDLVNANPRDRAILIYFDIPNTVKNVLKTHGVLVMGYKFDVSGTTRKLEMYAILPENAAWTEGNRCNQTGIDESTWSRIRFKSGDPNNGDNWAGSAGCQTLGTDVENILLSNPTIGSQDAWLEFTSNGDNLTDFGDRILKHREQNLGFMMRTEEDGSISTTCKFRSSEYTTDVSLRPKMLFLYEELGSGLDAISEKYFDSVANEETNLSQSFGSTEYSSNYYTDERLEKHNSSMKINNNEISDDFSKELLGGQ